MFRLSALALISFVSFGADPALLKLLPPSATVIAGIDVDRAKDSPFGQYVLTQWRSDDKGFSEFISLTGFDPRRDLREVMFASLPQAAQHNGAFVAKGTFEPAPQRGVALLESGMEARRIRKVRQDVRRHPTARRARRRPGDHVRPVLAPRPDPHPAAQG